MNKFILITGVLIAVILKVCADNRTEIIPFNDLENLIINGAPAVSGEIPWQIFIIMDHHYMCSGSIINSEHALTAAHCCRGFKLFQLGMGTLYFHWKTKNFTRTTRTCKIHNRFDRTTLTNDIAILTFKAIAFTQHIQPIALPRGAERLKSFANLKAVTSGWGKERSGKVAKTLKRITVTVITNKSCATFYRHIGSTKLCAKGNGIKSTCQGDSGGPLYRKINNTNKKMLIGIVSFGSSLGCDKRKFFGYTRVTKYLRWIEMNQ